MTELVSKKSWKEWAAVRLFWSWNVIYLSFMVFGFAPRILPETIASVRSGLIPLVYFLDALVLSLIPVGVVLLGLTLLRRSPERLFALGYVVEGPLMLILAVRFFIIRQATASFNVLMGIAIVGMAAFLWSLLDQDGDFRSSRPRYRWVPTLRLFGLTFMLLTSLYAAVWIAFYAAPMIAFIFQQIGYMLTHLAQFFRDFGQFLRGFFSGGWVWLPFALLGFALLLYTMTLFVLTPIAVPVLSVRAWLRSLADQPGGQPVWIPRMAVFSALVLSIALFTTANQQPQKNAFALLQRQPASLEAARDLLAQEKTIRAGLLNAYLAPFRYSSALGEVSHIRWIYEDIMNLSRGSAVKVQKLYESIALPLLYQPVHAQTGDNLVDNLAFQREPDEAAGLYQHFFDVPIAVAERDEIVRAARSTWSSDQAEQAWQAVDEREVHLARQEVTITEHGDWAEVELYEVYENRTRTQQEVIYYFNLPETAVITGLWLGSTADREARMAFQVAPRGAAQAVYRNEVRRQVDPALLEQIGPRQYRLRAYPVPAMTVTWNESRTAQVDQTAPPLHLWMTYTTLAVDGAWPLPNLAYCRNVYWDDFTERLINGSPALAKDGLWIPSTSIIPAAAAPASHRFDFPDGQSVLAQPAGSSSTPALPADVRLAVVLDRSKSMEAHAADVTSAIAAIQSAAGGAARIDVYLTSSQFRGQKPEMVSLADFDPQTVLYFGGQNPAELIAQFEQVQSGRAYDAVIVLTDDTAYELGASELDVAIPDAPLWMVHLGEKIPLGYDDKTLDAIQASGGGTEGNIVHALNRIAIALENRAAPGPMTQDLVDGYLWTVLPTSEIQEKPTRGGDRSDAPLLARQLILAEQRRSGGEIKQLQTLDALHTLAQQYGIVTPYSSMIVLVNARQESILEHLEDQEDRYERELEDLKNTTPTTQVPLSGVPEPEEWLLLSLVALMVAWYLYKQRAAAPAGLRH